VATTDYLCMGKSAWENLKTRSAQMFETVNEAADRNIENRRMQQLEQFQAEEQAKRLSDDQALKAAPNVGSQLSEEQAQAQFAEYLKQQELKNQAEEVMGAKQEILRQQELGHQGWKKYPVQGR